MVSVKTVMRWLIGSFAAIGVWTASPCSPARAAMITWKTNWTLDHWFDKTRPPSDGVDLAKEAFGAGSTKDMQITGQDQMPAVGKAAAKRHRIEAFGITKEGGVFTRQFMLDADARASLTATIKGKFIATGTFVAGQGNTDFINATDFIAVNGVGSSGTAFYQLAAPQLVAGTFPVDPDPKKNTEKTNVVELKKDVLYTLTFDFSTDAQLTGGKKGKPEATLESAFFDTFTGDMSLVSSPEPSTFTLFGLGSLGSLGYGWWRRKRIA